MIIMSRALKGQPITILAGLILMIALVLSVFGPWLTPFDPLMVFEGQYRVLPFFAMPAGSGSSPYILGTDDVGRDILSRLIAGTRVSMAAGLSVAALSMFIGVGLGAIAGWLGGWVELIILRTMDTLMALPSILLAIVVVTILGPSLINAVLAAGITAIPGFVRVVRASIQLEKKKPYALAAKLYGASGFRTVLLELLPNCLAPILVQATLGFGDGILNVAALGFLGLGARPPTPEWGTMLADARPFVESDPWLVTGPGLCILLVILAFNILGDQVRDWLDPKLKARAR